MSIINLVDCNNIVRIRFEKDAYALRNLFEWAFRDPEPHIFVFDGQNAKAARRDIYPEYKVGRTPAPDNFYKQLEIFSELLRCTNKVQMKVPRYEADDAIASMVFNNPTAKFRVHSNDGDFMRLVNENVSVTTPTIKDVKPEDIRLYKTLVGDQSDKVPGVRLFGQKSWAASTPEHKENWVKLLTMLEGVPEGQEPMVATGGLNLTEKQQEWLVDNWRLVRSFWLVVDFMRVPPEAMTASMIVGTPQYTRADALLKELFL